MFLYDVILFDIRHTILYQLLLILKEDIKLTQYATLWLRASFSINFTPTEKKKEKNPFM